MKDIENKENSPFSEGDNPALTDREKEVLELVGHGFSQKEIAGILHLSVDGRQAHIEHKGKISYQQVYRNDRCLYGNKKVEEV